MIADLTAQRIQRNRVSPGSAVRLDASAADTVISAASSSRRAALRQQRQQLEAADVHSMPLCEAAAQNMLRIFNDATINQVANG